MTTRQADESTRSYDVIGDIHGYLDPLNRLLKKMGYRDDAGAFRHPEGRQVVFVGDFIDRGPAIRETLHLVKNMLDAGSALAVMGNHEFNAICYHTPNGNGDFLRSHNEKNKEQHRATLEAFAGNKGEWEEWIAWFKGLPFSLDLGDLRVVHATWSAEDIEFLEGKSLNNIEFLRASAKKGSSEFSAIETVLKGIEIPLPKGTHFVDKQGIKRPEIRVKWWASPANKSYRELVFPDCNAVPDAPVEFDRVKPWTDYPATDPPVFFGHYWLPHSPKPEPVAPNAACLDYSVAKPPGKLVAYRWDGEAKLENGKFVGEKT